MQHRVIKVFSRQIVGRSVPCIAQQVWNRNLSVQSNGFRNQSDSKPNNLFLAAVVCVGIGLIANYPQSKIFCDDQMNGKKERMVSDAIEGKGEFSMQAYELLERSAIALDSGDIYGCMDSINSSSENLQKQLILIEDLIRDTNRAIDKSKDPAASKQLNIQLDALEKRKQHISKEILFNQDKLLYFRSAVPLEKKIHEIENSTKDYLASNLSFSLSCLAKGDFKPFLELLERVLKAYKDMETLSLQSLQLNDQYRSPNFKKRSIQNLQSIQSKIQSIKTVLHYCCFVSFFDSALSSNILSEKIKYYEDALQQVDKFRASSSKSSEATFVLDLPMDLPPPLLKYFQDGITSFEELGLQAELQLALFRLDSVVTSALNEYKTHGKMGVKQLIPTVKGVLSAVAKSLNYYNSNGSSKMISGLEDVSPFLSHFSDLLVAFESLLDHLQEVIYSKKLNGDKWFLDKKKAEDQINLYKKSALSTETFALAGSELLSDLVTMNQKRITQRTYLQSCYYYFRGFLVTDYQNDSKFKEQGLMLLENGLQQIQIGLMMKEVARLFYELVNEVESLPDDQKLLFRAKISACHVKACEGNKVTNPKCASESIAYQEAVDSMKGFEKVSCWEKYDTTYKRAKELEAKLSEYKKTVFLPRFIHPVLASYDSLGFDLKNIIALLDLSTEKNRAMFWSGGMKKLAEAFANEHGKKTLEMTPGGQVLDILQLFGPGSPFDDSLALATWKITSLLFAKGATGIVEKKGSKKENPNSIWNTVEKPELKQKEKDGIVTILEENE